MRGDVIFQEVAFVFYIVPSYKELDLVEVNAIEEKLRSLTAFCVLSQSPCIELMIIIIIIVIIIVIIIIILIPN